MPTTPNMGLDLPTLGASAGEWDDKINDALTAIDLHDHTAGSGTEVPVAGLDIDDDLPFNGHGIEALGRCTFTPIAAPSDAISLFVNTADNELYWRTFSGTNVKLTSGTTINTSLVGGIAGDYSTVGAEVAYDDSADRYTFKQQGSPKTWARIASGDVRIYETGTSESVFVGLKAPAALGASYDITWPLAVPGSTSVMLMANDGTVTVSNTIPNAITFSAGVTCATTLAITGATTATGLVTVNAGLTAATGQHITVVGTGRHKRGTRHNNYPVQLATVTGGSIGATGGVAGLNWDVSTTGLVALPLLDGEANGQVIQAIRVYNAIAGTGTVSLRPYILDTDGTMTAAAAAQTPAVGDNPLVFTGGITALSTGQTLWLQIITAATNSGRVWSIAVESTVP